MSRQSAFTRRSVDDLHSSICLNCFRTVGISGVPLTLIGLELAHECASIDLLRQSHAVPDRISATRTAYSEALSRVVASQNSSIAAGC
jgi:hypothetical protein